MKKNLKNKMKKMVADVYKRQTADCEMYNCLLASEKLKEVAT